MKKLPFLSLLLWTPCTWAGPYTPGEGLNRLIVQQLESRRQAPTREHRLWFLSQADEKRPQLAAPPRQER